MRLVFALLLTSSILPLTSLAKTRLAFLETHRRGQLVQYEENGRFTHTAIQFEGMGDQWLNAYPKEGVAVVSMATLKTRGVVAEIVEIPDEVPWSQVVPFLGRPFDYWYSWNDSHIYCSELIAKLFNVPTSPMKINRDFWPENYWKLDGAPGVSPDALYAWALARSQGQ